MFLIGTDPAYDARPALLDAATGLRCSYAALRRRVAQLASTLAGEDAKRLVFLFCRNDEPTVVAYLAAVEAGHAVALLDGSLRCELTASLLERYRPELVLGLPEPLAGYQCEPLPLGTLLQRRPHIADSPPHEQLALLLSTSGSTGSPKLVRLTRQAVQHNAAAILKALEITDQERPITTLPLHYSFGLSVLNSHLLAGAEIVLTGDSIVTEGFWKAVRQWQCSSFAGVPYTYEMLRRLDLGRLVPDSLATMTQAGGKLANPLISQFHEFMAARGGRFFVMYGQTEATARITVLPADRLPAKLGSAGFPLAGGTIQILVDGRPATQPNVSGEVFYSGENVMLGYAETREDLTRGDELHGELQTGDIGYLDSDGALYITGRIKRIAKVFGLRINLEEVEAMVRLHGSAAAVGKQDCLVLFCEFTTSDAYAELTRTLAQRMGIHHSGIEFRYIEKLPVSANGKIDYRVLSELV